MASMKRVCAICRHSESGFPNDMSVVCAKCKHNPCLGKLYVPEEPVLLHVRKPVDQPATKYIILSALLSSAVILLLAVSKFLGWI